MDQLAPQINSLHALKAKKGISYADIAKQINRDEVYVAAIFFGQAKPTEDDVKGLAKALDTDAAPFLEHFHPNFFPNRGLGPLPPTDPLLYRLYEIVVVYGYPLKAVINEKFGDGIMSAIDIVINVDKHQENGADRVKITLDGKWLPHRRF